LTIIWLYPWIN